jgi:hypothetical protein
LRKCGQLTKRDQRGGERPDKVPSGGNHREIREIREIGNHREIREIREITEIRNHREIREIREIRKIRELNLGFIFHGPSRRSRDLDLGFAYRFRVDSPSAGFHG